jgi:hypothetical protein
MFGDSPTKENKSPAGSSSVPAATNPVSPDASPASTPTQKTLMTLPKLGLMMFLRHKLHQPQQHWQLPEQKFSG